MGKAVLHYGRKSRYWEKVAATCVFFLFLLLFPGMFAFATASPDWLKALIKLPAIILGIVLVWSLIMRVMAEIWEN